MRDANDGGRCDSRDLTEVDDQALVDGIRRSEDAAMAEVMRRHRDAVFSFARRIVRDPSRAEEITQDVFLRLWERSDRFEAGRGSLKSFLMALTHGRSIDVTRADVSRKAREARDARRIVAADDGVERAVVSRSVAEALHAALARLPDREREALVLAHFGDHSYRAVAEMLGEAEGTVKSRIRSGLAHLRVELSAQDLDGS